MIQEQYALIGDDPRTIVFIEYDRENSGNSLFLSDKIFLKGDMLVFTSFQSCAELRIDTKLYKGKWTVSKKDNQNIFEYVARLSDAQKIIIRTVFDIKEILNGKQ